MIPTIVPDTSVLLKWVVESGDEEDKDSAIKIRDAWVAGKCTIVVPSLWFFEAGNILGMKQPNLAETLMKILVGYGFDEEPAAAIHKKALELMRKFKVTFYDAAYHVTAINHSGTLITADNTYYRKASQEGHVELLSRWSSV